MFHVGVKVLSFKGTRAATASRSKAVGGSDQEGGEQGLRGRPQNRARRSRPFLGKNIICWSYKKRTYSP